MVIDDFKSSLKKSGNSVTTARIGVFSALAQHGPIAPARLAELLTTAHDRASVYRTISLFEELGFVRRVPMGWKYLVELSDMFSHHHHHLVCTRCQISVEIEDDLVLESAIKKMTKNYGFSDLKHELEISGVCKTCFKNMEPR